MLRLHSQLLTLCSSQGCYLGDGDIVVLCAYLGQLGRVRDALSDQVTVVLDERDATALEDQEGLSKAEELTSTIERVQASRKVFDMRTERVHQWLNIS